MRDFFLCIAFIAVISMSNYLSDKSEREDEMQQVKIIKEAENSNDPVLKQKAENIKAKIYNQIKKDQEEKQKFTSNRDTNELHESQKLAGNFIYVLINISVMLVMAFFAVKVFNKIKMK